MDLNVVYVVYIPQSYITCSWSIVVPATKKKKLLNQIHPGSDMGAAPITAQLLGRLSVVDCVLNVMAHAHKTHFVFRRNGLNGRGRQFSRLLAAEVCASAVVMLHTPCSEVV